MKLYVFDSERAYGLTDASDASSRLPNEFGDWKFWKHLDMESEEFGRIDVNSRDCLADIEKRELSGSAVQPYRITATVELRSPI